MKTKYLVFGLCWSLIALVSCNKNPKVITATQEGENQTGGSGIFSQDAPAPIPTTPETGLDGDIHSVTVLEVLPTTKYVYLRVKEGQEEFWIATLKREVEVGKSYYYHGGLLKTNFESKEHNRMFEKLYLVSAIVETDHANTSLPNSQPSANATNGGKADATVSIAALVANPRQYAGKRVQITGTCVKINPNIMGRNWVHLRDGSQDDYDLVITCGVMIPEGHKVTMVGTVVLDKDFGSGYSYEILLEGGEVVM